MANVAFSARLQELKAIEDNVIKGNVPYARERAGKLYDAVRILRECASFITNSEGLASITSLSRRQEIIQGFDDMLDKLKRVSTSQAVESVFNSILSDVVAYRKSVMPQLGGELEDPAGFLAAQQEIAVLSARLSHYEKLVEEMERNAEKVRGATSTVVGYAEGKTSKEWAEEYLQYVAPESEAKRKTLALRKMYNNRLKERANTKGAWRLLYVVWGFWVSRIKIPFISGVTIVFIDKLFYTGLSYANMVVKWRAWRALWLFGLFCLSLAYIVFFWQYDFPNKDIVVFFIEKSAFLPLLVVMTIGFTFCSRNFRVNAHILEQYKHRYIVAKTLNSLMTLDGLQEDGVIKTELIQQGTRTLFEFKYSGYMGKHQEGEGVPLRELINLLGKDSNKQS